MKRIFTIALLMYACSEAEEGAPDSGTSSLGNDAGQSSETGATNPGGDDDDGKPPVPTGDASLGKGVVIFNEVNPSGEWIELVNAGTGAIDISGFAVADNSKDDAGPKIDEAARLPQGLILSPKSYLLIQAGGLDGGPECPAGGWSYCIHGEFGVSNKDGEVLYFLDQTNHIVDTVTYPPSGVTKPDTYGRLPSGDPSGTFQATKATPGAANEAK